MSRSPIRQFIAKCTILQQLQIQRCRTQGLGRAVALRFEPPLQTAVRRGSSRTTRAKARATRAKARARRREARTVAKVVAEEAIARRKARARRGWMSTRMPELNGRQGGPSSSIVQPVRGPRVAVSSRATGVAGAETDRSRGRLVDEPLFRRDSNAPEAALRSFSSSSWTRRFHLEILVVG